MRSRVLLRTLAWGHRTICRPSEECEGGGLTLPVDHSGKGQSELGRTTEGFEFRKVVEGGGGWWLVEGGGGCWKVVEGGTVDLCELPSSSLERPLLAPWCLPYLCALRRVGRTG